MLAFSFTRETERESERASEREREKEIRILRAYLTIGSLKFFAILAFDKIKRLDTNRLPEMVHETIGDDLFRTGLLV